MGHPSGAQALPAGEQAALDRRLQELGRLRALQGISINVVVEIMRLDFIVLWRGLAARSTPQTQNALISHAERVQAAVDEISSQVRVAFMQEHAAMRNDARVSAQRHLERLFSAPKLSDTDFEAIARHVGLDQNALYDVLVASPAHAAKLEQALAPYLAAGSAWGIYVRQSFCAFYPTVVDVNGVPSAEESSETMAKEAYRDGVHPCEDSAKAVASIVLPAQRGLSAVRACFAGLIELATDVENADTIGGAGLLTAKEAFPIALSSYGYRLLPGLIDERVDCIQKLPEKERMKLIKTVKSYLFDGSVKTTARSLNCHRNTVINRLRSFHSITGLSPMVPSDVPYIEMVLYRIRSAAT